MDQLRESISRKGPRWSGGYQRQVPVARALREFLSGRDLCTPIPSSALYTMVKNLLELES